VDAVAMKSALLSAPRHLGGMRMSVAHPNKKEFIGGKLWLLRFGLEERAATGRTCPAWGGGGSAEKEAAYGNPQKNRKKSCMNFVVRAFYMVGAVCPGPRSFLEIGFKISNFKFKILNSELYPLQ
jgi:hypothetical protein